MLQPKKNKATRQDSLAVYNQSKKVEKFYNDADYSNVSKYMDKKFGKTTNPLKANDDANKRYQGDADVVGRTNITEVINGIPKEDYRKTIDSNRYEQRETNNRKLNIKAPLQLFDKRIVPKTEVAYSKNGDIAKIHSYNNIANKPFDLLTSKEKKQRVEQYGREGVPDSYGKPIVSKEILALRKQSDEYRKTHPEYPIAYDGIKETIVKPVIRPKLTTNSLKSKPIIENSQELKSDVNVRVPVRTPKSYKVEETTPLKFGGHKTTYNVSDASNISDAIMIGDNKRIITPTYKKGGKINKKY